MNFIVNKAHLSLKEYDYDKLLREQFPYYSHLNDSEKLRFGKRVSIYCCSKIFHQLELEIHAHIPVLISAAAVQLTFGLRRYRMKHFDHFYIYKEAYYTPESPRRLIGHVGKDDVHISWKHFTEGYGNYTDKENVGLHELAHALEYGTFVVGSNINNTFVKGYREFAIAGRMIFHKLCINGHPFFSEYATTNFQEFWAECVECFFEAPKEFKEQLPEVYTCLCNMLNQDPSNRIARLRRARLLSAY